MKARLKGERVAELKEDTIETVLPRKLLQVDTQNTSMTAFQGPGNTWAAWNKSVPRKNQLICPEIEIHENQRRISKVNRPQVCPRLHIQ